MCGIVGIAFMGELDYTKEVERQKVAWRLGTELLVATQSRGEDATGVATVFNDGNYIGLKMGIPSSEFVMRVGGKETDYNGFLKIWKKVLLNQTKPKIAKAFIGHCRKTTLGSVWNNDNNHPIHVEPILGVHNGSITNHDQIFQKIDRKRIGTVDSESIFQLLHVFTKEGKTPITEEVLKEVTRRLQGTFGCIAINTNDPNKMAIFRDGRPIVVAIVRSLNMLVIASEAELFNTALYRYNKEAALYSGLYEEESKLPVINKKDIDVVTLLDDHFSILNLMHPVENTPVAEVVPQVRIERSNKLWNTAANTTYGNQYTGYDYYNRTHNKTTAQSTTGVTPATTNNNLPVVSNKTADVDKKGVCGFLWVDDANKYKDVTEDDLKELDRLGNMEIEKKDDNFVISDEIDNLLDITVVEDKESKTPQEKKFILKEVPLDKTHITPEPSKSSNVKTVTIGNDPEALKKALAYSKAIPKLENNEEIAELIELSSEADVDVLPSLPLVNRVIKITSKKAYYDALMAVAEEKVNSKTTSDSASKIVRLLTKSSKDFESNMLSPNKQLGTVKDFILRNLAMDKQEPYYSLSTEDINSVFPEEKIKEDPILNEVYNYLERAK